uniref:Uncharacterized protein n=1 Tax=Tanacetum cinerariifolium TaxID=118510 RepID=A0A699HYE1_TANCI|nr:hypothetical protein [Tanacetum cinerariifolium]
MKRAYKGYIGVDIPLFPVMIVQGLIFQGEGSIVPVESHHAATGTPSTSQPHLSSPPRSSISQETKVPQPSSPTHTYLADGAASIEKTVKTSQARRKAKIMVSDEEVNLEDPSKQGRKIEEIDQDLDISLIQHDEDIQGRYEQDMEFDFDVANEVSTTEQVSTTGTAVTTASVDISPASPTRRVSTADDIIMAETLVYIKISAAKIKDKARVEADEELTQRLQAEERDKYSKVDQAKMLEDLINQIKKYFTEKRAEERRNKPMTTENLYRVNTFVPMDTKRTSELVARSSKKVAKESLNQGSSKRQKTNEASGSVQEQPDEEETDLSQEDLQQLMIVVPVEGVYIEALQVELKSLYEPDTDDTLWKLHRYMHDPLTWRLYDTCGVYHVSTEKEMDIFMLVEKEYTLPKGF